MLLGSLFDMEINWTDDVKVDTPHTFENIERELKEYLLEHPIEGDSRDGIFDFLDNLMNKVQEDFDEIIGENTDKRNFIRSLTRISGADSGYVESFGLTNLFFRIKYLTKINIAR